MNNKNLGRMTRVVIPADARRSLERSRSAVRQKNTNTNNKDISRRPFEITLAVLGATKPVLTYS
uniref:Kinesin motor domain-containing protein n=1 Tax=Heterorhabditis bacteriophora TaxID=37862 RepID=A0A1I7X2N2_HETBA